MEYLVSALVVIALVVFIFLKNSYDEKKKLEKMVKVFSESYGKKPNKKYETGEMENIKLFFERFKSESSIDDITANDLDLDSVFKRINYCKSSMGSEYLYYRLRTLCEDQKKLDDLEKKIEEISENSEERNILLKYFFNIGRLKSFSFYDSLEYFADIKIRSLLPEIISFILFVAGISALFFLPPLAAFLLIGVVVYNIISYYSLRGRIEESIVIFGYIIRFINLSHEMCRIESEVFKDDMEFIKENTSKLSGLLKKSRMVVNKQTSGAGIGNPIEMLADYVKMIFHIDLIMFNKMLEEVQGNIENICELYVKLGEIETVISLAYYRASLESYCIPRRDVTIGMVNGYHPLIDNPVKNTLTTNKSVLITGSNASGKSTFLKTVAINYLFANTINTCLADEFKAPMMHLFSSMSLRDSLESSDSYFMVEIKAIKRIIDYAKKHPDEKILCFVDEVLRGTNTVERIAAGCEILKYFTGSNIVCFAATHDGELTILLEDLYDNYHFDEEISGNDVLFNYMIKSGRATSRNAIRLLNVMGFDDSIVEKAELMAKGFVETGEWR